jgi:hypothetical protein
MLTATGEGHYEAEVAVQIMVTVQVSITITVTVAFLSASGSALPCLGDAVDSPAVVQFSMFDVIHGGDRGERQSERNEWGR